MYLHIGRLDSTSPPLEGGRRTPLLLPVRGGDSTVLFWSEEYEEMEAIPESSDLAIFGGRFRCAQH